MSYTPLVAIVCITGLGIAALIMGVDGAIFGLVITLIAGLGGYEIGRRRKHG